MGDKSADLGSLLEVGIQAVIATQPNSPQSPRYLVPLKGWEAGEYLMFEAPIVKKEDGVGGRQRRISVRKKSEVVVRFIKEGCVCAFREVVTDSLTLRDLPHFTVKWPVAFETAYVRKHERVRLSGKCEVTLADGSKVEGELRDISEGGCAIDMDTHLDRDAVYTMDIAFPDGGSLLGLTCHVRNARGGDIGQIHGSEFAGLSDTLKQELRIVVKTALSNVRKPEAEDNVTVLALTTKEKPKGVFGGIRFKGVDFIVVSDVVECFHLLRSLPCVALIVDCDHDNWSGLDVAGLFKDSAKTEGIKLVVYGIAESQVDVTTSIIGADLCIAKGAAPHELAQHLAQLLADSIPNFS